MRRHLLIEEALDGAIELMFFNSQYVFKGRFEFESKVQMVRAMSRRKRAVALEWDVILAMNTLRWPLQS